MSKQHDGGPAFPVWELNGQGKPEMTGFGMSLRDYFAAKAMQGFLSDPKWRDNVIDELTASHAYRMADAMMEARSVNTPPPPAKTITE